MYKQFLFFKISPFSRRLYTVLREFNKGALLERTLNTTQSASEQLQILCKKFPDKRLRIAVEAGGCHGFQYKFTLDKVENVSNDEDITFVADNDQHNSNCSLICDKISWSFLKDARLDYSKELIGSTFQIIDNPIAGTGCGCGVSFELKAQPDVEKTK